MKQFVIFFLYGLWHSDSWWERDKEVWREMQALLKSEIFIIGLKGWGVSPET